MKQMSIGVLVGLVCLACHLVSGQCDLAHRFNAQLGAKQMKNELGYSTPDRKGATANAYLGAASHGHGWVINWKGPYNRGPKVIDVLRASLDHLTHLQRTDAASEDNAKLINHIVQAIEEFDGVKPTLGGDLNNLIPKLED